MKKILLCATICFPLLWDYGLFLSPAISSALQFQVHSKMVQVSRDCWNSLSSLACLKRGVHEPLCCPVAEVMTCVRMVLESRAGSLFGWHSCSGKGMSDPSTNELNWTGKIELHRISVCAYLDSLCECWQWEKKMRLLCSKYYCCCSCLGCEK